MRHVERADSAQQALTVLATGLHETMRACDGEVCLELLVLLSGGERGVGALAKMLSLDMPSVSGRLTNMKRRGLVVGRGEGNRRFYSLSERVKIGTRAKFRVIRVRAIGGTEIKLAVPLKVIDLVGVRWKEVEASEEAHGKAEAEVSPVNVRELAARVARAEGRTSKGE